MLNNGTIETSKFNAGHLEDGGLQLLLTKRMCAVPEDFLNNTAAGRSPREEG